jgi:hypothetical protein
VPEAGFFMTIGGLGVTLAGFTGLITALDRRPADAAVVEWRIRNLVLDSLALTLVGFGVVALYWLTDGNLPLSIRLASAMGLARQMAALAPSNLTGPAWAGLSPGQRRLSILGLGVGGAVWGVGIVFGSLRVFHAVVVVALVGPLSILYNTIHDAADSRRRDDA